MAKFLDLSNEILVEIFRHLRPYQAKPQGACAAALVCRRFSDILRPIIFRKLDECAEPFNSQRFPQPLELVSRSLDANSALAGKVQEVALEWDTASSESSQIQEFISRLISRLTSTKRLTLTSTRTCDDDDVIQDQVFRPWFLENDGLPCLKRLSLVRKYLSLPELITYLSTPSLNILNLSNSTVSDDFVEPSRLQKSRCNITTVSFENVPIDSMQRLLQFTGRLETLKILWRQYDDDAADYEDLASILSRKMLLALSPILDTLEEYILKVDTLLLRYTYEEWPLDLSTARTLKRITVPAYHFFSKDGFETRLRLGFYKLLHSSIEEIEVSH